MVTKEFLKAKFDCTIKEGKTLSIARSAVGQKQLLLSMVVTKYLMVHLNIAENHNDTVRMFRNSKQSGIPS